MKLYPRINIALIWNDSKDFRSVFYKVLTKLTSMFSYKIAKFNLITYLHRFLAFTDNFKQVQVNVYVTLLCLE